MHTGTRVLDARAPAQPVKTLYLPFRCKECKEAGHLTKHEFRREQPAKWQGGACRIASEKITSKRLAQPYVHTSAEHEHRQLFDMNKTEAHRWNRLAGQKDCDVVCHCVFDTSGRDRH